MSAHTPGPWKQRTGPEGTREIVGGRHGLEFVCQYGHESTSDEIVEADGALIAAAPDLLAALKALAEIVDAAQWGKPWPGRPHAEMDAARSAIARAECR